MENMSKNNCVDKEMETSETSSNDWKLMGIGEKCKYLFNNITVEPILACYIMPSVLAGMATQNLTLEKACRANLKYDDSVCNALAARDTANYTFEETEVQKLVASMTVWKAIVQCSLPACLILFMGSWSDRRGRRKPCLLLPIVGEFLTSIGLLVCAYFMTELPMEVAGVVEAVFPALTGGWMTMFMAIFSYIADVTSVKMRTFRIGIVNVFVSLGIPVGTALSGILYQLIGFFGMFSLTSVLYVIGFTYGMIRLKEVRKPTPRDPNKSFLADFFDVKHVSETVKVAFKKREGNRKQRLLLIMILSIVMIGPLFGEMGVTYLFTRYRFNWNEVDFSIYSTYCVMVNLIGTMICIGLFSHILKVNDAIIGMVACISKIASSFLFAYSTTGFMFYMAPIIDIFSGSGLIVMRSMVSKLVPTEELGKMNSLYGVCEAIAPLIYNPLYSMVYSRSLKTMPGLFFLLGSGLTVPALVIFLWMYILERRETKLDSCKPESKLESLKSKVELNGEAYVNEAFNDDADINV